MISSKSVNKTDTSEQLNALYARELLPLTISLGVLAFLGVLGNILTIIVFSISKDYRGRNTFRVFVLTLAIIDLITCLTLFPIEMLTHRYFFAFINVTLCKMKCFLTVNCASASSLALLLISVDRFRKVIYPFKRQFTTSLSIKVLVIFVFVIPLIISIPAAIMCGINKTYKTYFDDEIIEINVCETEDEYKTSKWRIIYKFVLLISELGISFVYIILYTSVMKEAWRQMIFEKSRQISTFIEVQKGNSNELRKYDIAKGKQVAREEDDFMELSIKRSNEEPTGLIKEIDHLKTEKAEKIKRHISKQSQLSVLSQKAIFPTKTLVWFVLTLIFIVTFMIHLGLTFKVTETVNMSTNELFWFLLFYRIYFINNIINPVVYAAFLKTFRDSCRRLLTMKCYS